MKRPIVTLSLVGLFAFPVMSACNQAETPDEEGGSSGTGNSAAGTGGGLIPMAGTGNTTAGTGNVTPTAGSGAGGAVTAGTGAGGMAGATVGGGSSGTGGAAAGASGSGGGPAAGCPVKIDSKVACTQVITCNDAYCGVHQLGSKDCSCAAASGMFMCSSCTYAGTEEIVQKPAAALAACASADSVLEDTPGCTKGMRCKSLTPDKERFCACWDDVVEGGTAWDCDSFPSAWL